MATSLSNLGVFRSDLGRHEEALTAAEQSLEIRRRLAAANPAGREADLARSLSNLGLVLSGVGQYAGALAAVQEAASIYQLRLKRVPGLAGELRSTLVRAADTLAGLNQRDAAATVRRFTADGELDQAPSALQGLTTP